MATTQNTPTPTCNAERTGDGYWTCDHPSGCDDCRQLAYDANDGETLNFWRGQLPGA